MQLSDYEIEQICAENYYKAIDLMSRHDYVDYVYEFQNRVEQDYKDWVYPRLNWRVSESQKNISFKWQSKLRAEAGQWFEENVMRRRNAEKEEARRRREEEEREEEREQERRARDNQRRREEQQQLKEEERLRREEQQRLEEEEADRRWEEEEQRRKDTNLQNKKKLEALQAQWNSEREKTGASEPPKFHHESSPQKVETKRADNLKVCKKCGTQLQPDHLFCYYCGEKQEMKVFCTECGIQLQPDHLFCYNCGTPVEK